MADPQRDLAPIIEPPPFVAPNAAAAPAFGLIAAIVVLGLVLVLAGFLWWRHRAPLRALRALPRSTDPVAAADQLAALVRRHGIAADAAWHAELDRLRFGPPLTDAAAILGRLCGEAASAFTPRQ